MSMCRIISCVVGRGGLLWPVYSLSKTLAFALLRFVLEGQICLLLQVSRLPIFAFLSHMKKVQFSSVAQSCPTLCNPINCSTPGLPVHHQLLDFTQTQVRWVGDAIQPSHPVIPLLLSTSIFCSIGIFSNESVLYIRWPAFGVSASASVLPMNIQDLFPWRLQTNDW